MRLSDSEYSQKNFYNTLNKMCGGKLYSMLEAIGKEPAPEFYERFKEPQRKRIGSERVGAQYHWALATAARKPKEGSVLGQKILEFLGAVEQESDGLAADQMSAHMQARLGEIVTKVMVSEFDQKQRLQASAVQRAPSTPTSSQTIAIN